jgi:hypothetical protein
MSSGTTITSSSRRFSSIAAFTAAGFLSGILTAVSLSFFDSINPFVGATFGAVIVICLSVRQRMWSPGRIISFIASSVIAYFAAAWSPIGAIYVFRALVKIPDQNVPGIFGPFMFSVAGFVGAFVIMLAVLILFFQERGWRVTARALLLALPGALLGLLSAITSESIQKIASHWISPSTSWGWGPEQFYSAYLIWQTGMALAIAAFVPQRSTLSLPEQSARIEPSLMKLSISGKIFAIGMLAGATVLGFFEARKQYLEWHQYGRIEKLREPSPSTENLPEVRLRPLDEALILGSINGYVESGAELSRIAAQEKYWQRDSGSSSLVAVPRLLYAIRYQRPETKNSPILSVTAQVWEYPNAAWAKYQLKATPFGDPPITYPGQIKQVAKFGNPVLVNALSGGPVPYVYWPSTTRIIVLHYSGPEDDEFVRQYLVRYPSSL